MTSRRLLATGLGVAALLVVAGIASHGRPLAGGGGRGPTAAFFDYVATTLVIVAVLMLGVVVYTLFSERTGRLPAPRGPWHVVSQLVTLAGAALLAAFLLHTGFEQRLRKAAGDLAERQQRAGTQTAGKHGAPVRDPRLRWDEIAIVAALLGGTALVLLAGRRTRRPLRPLRLGGREEAVSAALDESLDDLRADPDLRRAIVAAYARMERALAGAGLARHPAEAPFEYVARALTSLDASAESAERLTALFEWAKFSQHEPGPEMRDEAIDALVAVRDELRRPAVEALPA